MAKTSRKYLLRVEDIGGDFVTFQLPFSIDFHIEKNGVSSGNLNLTIYNISKYNQNRLRLDPFNDSNNRSVTLYAGYDGEQGIPMVFLGVMTQCKTVRQGPDFITTIDAIEANFAQLNSTDSKTYPTNYSKLQMIKEEVKLLEIAGLKAGAIGLFTDGEKLPGSAAMGGNIIDRLKQYTGNALKVDNGLVHCLTDKQCIATPNPLVINHTSGLLGTPVREQTFLTFEMIFEPMIQMFRLVNVESVTATVINKQSEGTLPFQSYNGTFQVRYLKHTVTISPVVCGNAITHVGCWGGKFTPVELS